MKIGHTPLVYYTINKESFSFKSSVSNEVETFLNEHLLIIDALGKIKQGLDAMNDWCSKQKLPLHKTINEYIKTRKKYRAYYNHEHLINGIHKLKETKGLGSVILDEVYYLDFYEIERFGKTRLGTLMHFAKQGQNKDLLKIIVNEIENRIRNFIAIHHIEAVGFIPPTLPRKIQIMTYIEKKLNLNIPIIKLKKISGPIAVPQKSLSKMYERIENAKNTFVVPDQKPYSKILLLDDAIGSGATMNEIAQKLITKKIASTITAYRSRKFQRI